MLRIALLVAAVAGQSPDLLPKFATPCITPNYEDGYCVEVQQCALFMDALTSGRNETHEFIRASKCGPPNEHVELPKVCCGQHVDFLYKSSTSQSVYTSRPPTSRPSSRPVPARATATTRTSKTTKSGSKKPKRNPFPQHCGNVTLQLPSRIFGGVEARLGEFPWMARLRHKRSDGIFTYGCAGFLVSKWFVVTAAHCVESKQLEPLGPIFQVQLGEHNAYTNPDCEGLGNLRWCADPPLFLRIAKPVVHQNYSNDINQHNDIAIIPLKEPATFTDFVFPICLSGRYSDEIEMYLSGWGKTETRESSPKKLKVWLPRADWHQCGDVYRSVGVRVLESQVCAGGRDGKDSCSGDSGGPLMTQRGVGPWYAEGIVSFGMGCGLDGWPGIYTSVPFHKAWIKKTMNRYLRNHVPADEQ